MAQWIECWPVNQVLLVQFLVRACDWVAGQVPSRGCVQEITTHWCFTMMFFSLSFSFPSPLKINKIFKKKKKKKKQQVGQFPRGFCLHHSEKKSTSQHERRARAWERSVAGSRAGHLDPWVGRGRVARRQGLAGSFSPGTLNSKAVPSGDCCAGGPGLLEGIGVLITCQCTWDVPQGSRIHSLKGRRGSFLLIKSESTWLWRQTMTSDTRDHHKEHHNSLIKGQQPPQQQPSPQQKRS